MCRPTVRFVCGLLMVLLLASPAGISLGAERDAGFRIWTSSQGTHLRAKFVRADGLNVILLKEDGTEFSVPLTGLSRVDREYVVKQIDAGSKTEDGSGTAVGPTGSSELLEKCQQLSQQLTKAYKAPIAGAKPTIAVVEFSDLSGGVSDLGRLISEELITAFVSTGNYRVIERLLLNKAIAEHKLQVQGIVDPKSAKELGKILGVDVIVSGTIADMSGSVRVNARLIATETGELQSAAAVTIANASVSASNGPALSAIDRGSRPKYRLPFYEDFSKYQDGQETEWARGSVVRTGDDGRKWLVSTQNGQKTISIPVELPETAYIEFDYDAQTLQSNRDLGTILSSMSVVDATGAKYKIEWSIRSVPPDPFGAPAKPGATQLHHTLRLPGGTDQQGEYASRQPIRVSVEGNRVSVSAGRSCQVSATVLDFKKFTRFEVDLYKGPNAVLALTNFKVGKVPTGAGSSRQPSAGR